jgi:hypothetical protein
MRPILFTQLLKGLSRVLTKVVLVVGLLFWFSPLSYAGGGYQTSLFVEDSVNVLPMELLGSQYRRPYSFRLEYRDQGWKEATITKEANLQEWNAYLKIDEKQAEKIVYNAEQLNTVAVDVQQYLEFVHNTYSMVNGWAYRDRIEQLNTSPVRLQNQYLKSIKKAELLMQQTSSPVLKMRWLFIMMRLAHYSEQFALEKELYDKYAPNLRDKPEVVNSEVWYWIDSLLAGRLMKLARTPEERVRATYQFAKIFNKSKTKRIEAYYNFSIRTDQEWEMLMSICASPDEQAMMHFIRATGYNANTLAELKSILEIAPDSIWATELLAWELEYIQYPVRWMYPKHWTQPDKNNAVQDELIASHLLSKVDESDRKYREELKSLVDRIVRKKIQSDLFLAEFTQLYLKVLLNQPLTVADIVEFNRKYSRDSRVKHTKGLEMLIYIMNLKKIDAETENKLFEYVKWSESFDDDSDRNIMKFIYTALEPLYHRSNDLGKMLIARYRGYLDLDSTTYEELLHYIQFIESSDKNKWDEYILAQSELGRTGYGYYGQLDRGNSDFPYLLKAMKLMERKDFTAAIEVIHSINYKEFENYDGDNFHFNPFISTLSGNNRSGYGYQTSRFKYAEKMVQLSNRIADDDTDANAHYTFANGLYNASWFGNSPLLFKSYREGYQWTNGATDLSGATFHYKKALQFAKSDEEKAKILYALAKVEFAEIGIFIAEEEDHSGRWGWDYRFSGEYLVPSIERLQQYGFGEYFSQIKQYSDTRYYKEVIQQCSIYMYGEW